MKRSWILGAALLASTCFAATTGAQAAIECQAEIIKGRASHWSYRLIDGRKCWYEGRTQIPKSELFWPEREEPAGAANPKAIDAQSTNAQASPLPQAEREEFTDPEDGSCCWPPQTRDSFVQDSFESRWRSLGLKQRD
jgi:hypothetical protein